MTMISAKVIETKAISITSTPQTLVQLGFTQAQVDQADIAMLTTESDCRLIYGGSVVLTASVGHYVVAHVDREIPGNLIIQGLQLVRIGGSDIVGFVTLAKM